MTAHGMDSERLARCVTGILEDMKGQSINRIDVRRLTTVTDYMIVATATSRVHAKSLADGIVERMKERGERVAGVEGLPAAEWVLVDLGAVVAHVMLASIRARYDLEQLWSLQPASGA